ncbi:M23 family metallopeptidase [Nocardia mangyaensis]|uniref:M23 family metallopeptidase n=1 Tax=Nocardia mangyaensis TaxID=2213200 RepID=UPI00267557CD|nr:M23 family metallopeptidase [Nocardia mangyaensis]MDO3647369.1 M23 family metallopeptidase [Nocardia mangyaensis]
MSQHRVGPESISVQALLGDTGAGRPNRHRAEPSRTDRVRAAATAAVAAGALVGTAAQVAPALAFAAPLLPSQDDTKESVVPAAARQAAEVNLVAAREAAPAPVAAAPVNAVAAPIAAPVAAPFGIGHLPPEIAGPLSQVEDILQGIQHQVAPPQAARPVAGPISSGFGARWGAMHYGVDFADSLGAPIHSVANGTVIEAGPASGFGLWVRVLQDDGTTAVYGHVNEMLVSEGQRVNAGDVIATVGNRGQSTGPHLHLEIWDQGGAKMDPIPYLASRGVPMEWGPSSH